MGNDRNEGDKEQMWTPQEREDFIAKLQLVDKKLKEFSQRLQAQDEPVPCHKCGKQYGDAFTPTRLAGVISAYLCSGCLNAWSMHPDVNRMVDDLKVYEVIGTMEENQGDITKAVETMRTINGVRRELRECAMQWLKEKP